MGPSGAAPEDESGQAGLGGRDRCKEGGRGGWGGGKSEADGEVKGKSEGEREGKAQAEGRMRRRPQQMRPPGGGTARSAALEAWHAEVGRWGEEFVYRALVQQIAENLHNHGEFLFQGMVKFRSKAKAARLESVKNICGRNVTLPTLPAHNVPQCSVTRGFSKTLRLLDETA